MNYPQKIMTDLIEPNGPSEWIWPAEDTGLWDGPRQEWSSKFKDWIETHVPGRDCVVQAGGGCGMYPRLLADMFKRVYTFEPDQENFYFLNLNCKLPNIRKFNCALGDQHRNVVFFPPGTGNRGVGRTDLENDINIEAGEVPVLKVDDFVFPKLDLIFLDVENREIYALRGSINTITKHKPVIICECANDPIKNSLEKLGYVVAEQRGPDTLFKVADGTIS